MLFHSAISIAEQNGDQRPAGLPEQDGWRVSLGGGHLTIPEYPGSEDYRNRVVPWITAQYEDRLQLSFRGLELNTLPEDSRWSAGPLVTYQSGRTNRGAIRSFENVSGGVSGGGYIDYSLGPFSVSARAEHSLSGDISGMRGGVSADFNQFLGGQWLMGYSLGATWHSSNWSRGLYGVSEVDAAASDQPAYDPAGGITDVNIGARATWLISREWSTTTFVRYARLVGDAADSPIVSELGTRNQGLVAAVISYSF